MPDREKVIKGLVEISEYARAISQLPMGKIKTIVTGCPEAEPTVDTDNNVLSKWIEDSDHGQEYGTTWACCKCGHSMHHPYIWNPYERNWRYCPWCGKKMEV